ncbi:DNA helicase [Sarracenia purpurea var. burkii]
MQKNDQRITMLQVVDKMKVKHKDAGPKIKRDELEQLVIQLIVDRVLKEEFQHTAYATNSYVTIGPLAKYVLQGKKIVKLEVSSKQQGSMMKPSKRSLTSPGLEYKLDELRKELSSIHGGIFPHSILSTQQITMLSAQRPKSIEQLEKIIGKLKTEKYGSRILEVIGSYESENPHHKDLVDEEAESSKRSTKRLKTQKALVVIESSEEEA